MRLRRDLVRQTGNGSRPTRRMRWRRAGGGAAGAGVVCFFASVPSNLAALQAGIREIAAANKSPAGRAANALEGLVGHTSGFGRLWQAGARPYPASYDGSDSAGDWMRVCHGDGSLSRLARTGTSRTEDGSGPLSQE